MNSSSSTGTLSGRSKIALNQLTKILNRDQTNVDIMGPTFKHSAALSKNERVIKRPEILSDLTGQSTEHLHSHGMNSVECSALQLLQQHHHDLGKIIHSKRLRSATGQSRRRHTGQGQDRSKTLSKYTREMHVRQCTRTQRRTGEKISAKSTPQAQERTAGKIR